MEIVFIKMHCFYVQLQCFVMDLSLGVTSLIYIFQAHSLYECVNMTLNVTKHTIDFACYWLELNGILLSEVHIN